MNLVDEAIHKVGLGSLQLKLEEYYGRRLARIFVICMVIALIRYCIELLWRVGTFISDTVSSQFL